MDPELSLLHRLILKVVYLLAYSFRAQPISFHRFSQVIWQRFLRRARNRETQT